METTCYDGKWTYERIYDEQKLKPGDHICWHRPLCIWHHAIVTTIEQEINIIHYSDPTDPKVNKTSLSKAYAGDSFCDCCANACNKCDALYRINYQESYDADYSILRSRTLLNESRYNLLERNCEHFVRWCKTGSTNSSQIGIFWASLGKVALMIFIRVIALLILGLVQYSHEAAEENVKDRQRFESLERWIAGFYIFIITMIYIIYFLRSSGSRLHPVRNKRHDSENPCLCSDLYDKCTKDRGKRMRCCCCFWCSCFSLIRRPLHCLLCFCKYIESSPCTCCRRPCNLACGIFWRIFLREGLAALGTLLVVMYEEEITNADCIAEKSAEDRAAILIVLSAVAQIIGYFIGLVLGRFFEACCESRSCKINVVAADPTAGQNCCPI